jgi:steroid delta-isomerase-like uncharacterized protein
MSSQDLTQVAREIINGYSTSNWTGLKNLLTPDVIYDEAGTQRKAQGPDAFVRMLQEWKKAMTDSRGDVTRAFGTANLVALEITWTGTQDGAFTGPAGTVPASGKRQRTPAAMILTFQGDKVKEIRHYFDMVTFLQQIGAMPAMAARA